MLIKNRLTLLPFNNTHVQVEPNAEYFRETVLRSRRMVAEFWLTDPLQELVVVGVLVVLDVSRSEY